jgi:hypothetical protein
MRRLSFAIAAATIFALSGQAMARDLLEPSAIVGLSKADVPGFREAFGLPGVDYARYGQIFIAPLAWAEGADKRNEDAIARITLKNREYLARRWAEMTADRFGEGRKLAASANEPGTLVIEAKMTSARPNRTPYDMREMGLMNAQIYGVGSAGMQIAVRDGKTGEVLMILADRRDGENFRDNFNLAFFWGDTEQFMRRWASALTEVLPAGPKLPKAS